MEGLLDQIFGPKCIFMGFLPTGKRKWVKSRPDGTMEVIYLHSDRGFQYSAGFGLSFPWIPHGNWKRVLWHRTPKSAVLDLRFEPQNSFVWMIPKGRTVASEKAKAVSTEVCETCEPWFARMTDEQNIIHELECRRASPNFYTYVQGLTVYLFWQARIGKWKGFDSTAEEQLKSYFGEKGFPELKKLVEDEAVRSSSRKV
ncbi:MAG: hypothetical protein ABI042_03290 [Verrucomicrobiota bacterium]